MDDLASLALLGATRSPYEGLLGLVRAYSHGFSNFSPLYCNLLRPLITMLRLLVPYGYILIKIKKNS